ncbi:DUF4199 domain-containing protein [Flagellimonas algicola]|uniref:DUF4199 domain-containing protein n=1 Tax=Flagellimonas algicola TaxID=2583815 RepID=A0ABY2WQK4_9FLAO|nr:DUF4199 domain-containing protein [Allomuricauda algicola]TMU56931.1 DUF4199 domain-containing protein [Allomuricauda algicola]
MEENQPKVGTFSRNYGVLAGATGIIFSLMLYLADMHHERSFAIQAVQYLILAVFVVLAILQFKKANGGFISLIQAMKIGPGVAVVSFILGIIYFLIFSNVIEPNFMEQAYELGRQQALEQNPNLTTEQIDQSIEIQKKFFWVIMAVFMLLSVIFGFIVSLITGLIVKKDKPAY